MPGALPANERFLHMQDVLAEPNQNAKRLRQVLLNAPAQPPCLLLDIGQAKGSKAFAFQRIPGPIAELDRAGPPWAPFCVLSLDTVYSFHTCSFG